jgi:hypothetical protein
MHRTFWMLLLALALSGPALGRADAEDAPQAKPPAATDEHAPPPSVTIIGPKDAHGVLGRDVRSPANEDMGRIVDVIVDRTGTVRAAVIDFGGFLGVGSRKVVVDWTALHFAPETQPPQITVDLTRDQVKAAPEYRPGKPVVVLSAATMPVPEY